MATTADAIPRSAIAVAAWKTGQHERAHHALVDELLAICPEAYSAITAELDALTQ